ncbi:MAG: hypothetical protein IVW57_11140 [Ktedonobacterales bacterium]|nr:hypothetical protein [Ktedonobacterales bacterium]
MRNRTARWLAAHAYPIAAAAIIAAAVAIRVTLVGAGWPGTDSDDSTMGLMALHILTRGEHPLFFWGQAYMGTGEAYVGALMLALFGVSSFALKCGLIVLYAAFMSVMYWLLTQAFERKWALLGLVFLSLGADDMLYHQLNAYGGYLETLLFGALLTVLTCWLVRTADATTHARRRPWVYAGWGLAAGLGLWSDPLVAPFVALTALALVVTCWHEVRGRLALLALLGLVLGLSPWILYDITAPSLDAAKSFLQRTPAPSATTTAPTPTLGETAIRRVLGTVLVSIPNNTGEIPLCPVTVDEAWPPQRWTTPRVRGCMLVRGVWGAGILALLAGALTLEIKGFMVARRTPPAKWGVDERRRGARNVARLVALAAPGMTIVFFLFSSAASAAPWQYSRYLITLLIALPVALATLWAHAPPSHRAPWRWRGARRVDIASIAGLLVVLLALGTLTTYGEIGAQQARNQVQADLVRALLRQGDTAIYADFWTCFRTAFQSGERVVCSVLNARLEMLPNRYPPYDALVRTARPPAYVFPLPSAQADAFPSYAAQHGWRLDTHTVDGQYVLFHVVSAGG